MKYDSENTKFIEFNSLELLNFIFARKLIILFSAITGLLLASLIAINLEDKYVANVLLKESNISSPQRSSSISLNSFLSGGFNQSSSKSSEGIEVILSNDFFLLLEKKLDVLPYLLAVDSWDDKNKSIEFKTKIYDASKSEWKENSAYSNSDERLYYGFQVYKESISIQISKDTGFINISFKHFSPQFAKFFLENIISEVNETSRLKSYFQADQNISFLIQKLKDENSLEMKEAINSLISANLQTSVLAANNKNYFFDILDSPKVELFPSEPNRIYVILIGSLIGLIASLLGILIYFIFQEIFAKKNNMASY